MSDIIINQDNLSRFSKRLKKAVEKELGTSISLNQATLFIAKMLGNNSIHELQKNLAKGASLQEPISQQFSYIPNPENLEIITLCNGTEKRYLQYAIVFHDFMDRKGVIPYHNDSSYGVLNLFGEEAFVVNDLESAFHNIQQNHKYMILEYAIPAFSHMSYNLPICSKYYWIENGSIKSSKVRL